MSHEFSFVLPLAWRQVRPSFKTGASELRLWWTSQREKLALFSHSRDFVVHHAVGKDFLAVLRPDLQVRVEASQHEG